MAPPPETARRRPALRARLGVLCLATVAALGSAEWFLRATNVERLAWTNPELYEPDGELVYRMKPDVALRSHGTRFETNEHGYRGPSWSAQETDAARHVLFLGDSVTVGFGVRYEECFAARFGEVNPYGLEDVNVALCGYNYTQFFDAAERCVDEVRPALTVVTIVSNDFEEPYPIFERRDGGGSGPLEPVKRILRRHSSLYQFARKRARRLLHPNEVTALPDPKLMHADSPESEARFDDLERRVRELRERTGTPVVLAMFPMGIPEAGRARLRAIAEDTNSIWVDFGELWLDTPTYLAEGSLGWDGHPSAASHDRMARLLVRALDGRFE